MQWGAAGIPQSARRPLWEARTEDCPGAPSKVLLLAEACFRAHYSLSRP